MPTWTQITPDMWSQRDTEILMTAVQQDKFLGVDFDLVARELALRNAQAWRLETDDGAHVVVITQIKQHLAAREVFIWCFAGHGLIKHLKFVVECLTKFAVANGCDRVAGLAHPAIAKVYERKLGLKPKRMYFSLEVN